MVGDIRVTYFSKLKMVCTEFPSDNNFYIKRWNLIVLFNFENRKVVFFTFNTKRKIPASANNNISVL